MIKRLVLVILVLGVVFGGIFGWKHYQEQQIAAQAAMPRPPVTVAATRVEAETWQPYLHAVGSLTATQGVFVSTEIAGQVKSIHFESGLPVAAGDILVQLEDSVDQADLAGLIAERRLTELRFNRFAKLLNEKSVSRSDYDEAQANLQNAQAQVVGKQALIQKKVIRAPFSGILGIRQVDIGQYLAPGAQIVSLQALQPIYVDYAVPERFLAVLAQGQDVKVGVQAYPQRSFAGKISAINPRIDVGTRNVRVRATLDNRDQVLRPGMFAEVRTLLPERKQVLTLPERAISYNPYGDSVFVIEERAGVQVVQRRQVATGEVRKGRIEIGTGLTVGDQVVSAGQVKLRNGQSVRIDNSAVLDKEVAQP